MNQQKEMPEKKRKQQQHGMMRCEVKMNTLTYEK